MHRLPRSSILVMTSGCFSAVAAAWCSVMVVARSGTMVRAFQTRGVLPGRSISTNTPSLSPASSLFDRNTIRSRVARDTADLVEQTVGGKRYSLVEMPDSMKSTTVFVGNLCEFVHDQDLSKYFALVSSLRSVPASVVRKPDTESLRYGFVSFPSKEEKEVSSYSSAGLKLPCCCCLLQRKLKHSYHVVISSKMN